MKIGIAPTGAASLGMKKTELLPGVEMALPP
ncbi:hypothetical protein HNQ87_000143 [Pacificimonas flava]|nr:hypothetical protein [Pacificimonas flava]